MFAGSFCPSSIQIFAGENFICNCASSPARSEPEEKCNAVCFASRLAAQSDLMPKQNNVAFEPFARAGGVQVTSTKFIYSLDPLLVKHVLPTLSAFGDHLPKLWM